ncbi:MAG: polysaccharide biosynthesis protein [Oscillospiraceae bacterium]|nr:polysaccharide biosynthesis protein [Oscillospiraceae bacterium]
MAKQKQQSLINGAIILTLAMFVVKVVGILFKMPLTSEIGMVGRGYFDLVYQIYTPIFAIAMAGLPIAVSRMVSESVTLNRFRDTREILRTYSRIFMLTGAVGTVLLCALAYPYVAISKAPSEIIPGIFLIAPAIFFCCVSASIRGYYEGQRNMSPTAASQFIEALGKLAAGLFLARIVLNYGMNVYNSAKDADGAAVLWGVRVANDTEAHAVIVPWAAAGAVLGVTVGSVAGLIYLILRHKIKGDSITRLDLELAPAPRSSKEITRELIKLAFPVIVGALALNISNFIDTMTIVARTTAALGTDYDIVYGMHSASLDAAQASGSLNLNSASPAENYKLIATYLFGAYNTGVDFRNLLPTITAALGVSVLPVLAAAWTVRNRAEISRSVNSILRLCMLLALPGGLGMAVLARPFLTIIYGSGLAADGIPVAVPVLQVYGAAAVLLAVSTPITNMLQGIGRTDIPVKALIISAVVKITSNLIFIGIPSLNIYGSMIGTILFYVINVSIKLTYLKRLTGMKIDWKSVFLKPLFCASMCAGAAWACFGLFSRLMEKLIPALSEVTFFSGGIGEKLLNVNLASSFAAVGAAMLVYVVLLLLTRSITKDEVLGLPKGEKIVKKLEKHRLLG